MLEADDATAPEGSGEDRPAPAPQHRAEAPSPETSHEEASGEGGEADAEAEAEEIEFDFGGNKIRVAKGAIPEEVAEQLDKFTKGTWSDYTRRSQELAEQRKAADAALQLNQRLAGLKQDELATYARGLQVEADLGELSKVDLAALWQSNPDRARQISDAISAKRAEYERIANEVAGYGSRVASEIESHKAKAVEEGRKRVAQLVKGFDEAQVIPYVTKTYGIPEQQVRDWPMHPVFAALAHKAMKWDALQSKAAPVAAKPPASPAVPVKSIQAKAAPSAPRLDDPNLSMDEWARLRLKQRTRR
jgi:hypothetical protein